MRKGLVLLFGSVLLLIGCSKTPEHVIDEDHMAALMADMYKAEAMMEDEHNKFNNDSIKMVLRQSVLAKHNVTQDLLDTSLIWYAHNLEVYDKVYEDVVKQLDDEYNELAKGDFTSVTSTVNSDVKPSLPRYRAVGDTADIWGKSRTWSFLPGFVYNIITFDMKPDKESMSGDKYELAFKLVNMRKSMKVFVGVDYSDGSTSYQYRTMSSDGWKRTELQSDTAREIKRIYGYMEYKSMPRQVIYLDSVELLRTHLDRENYENAMRRQKWIGQVEEDKKDSDKEAVNQLKKTELKLDVEKSKNRNEKSTKNKRFVEKLNRSL